MPKRKRSRPEPERSRLADFLERGLFEERGFEHDAQVTQTICFLDAVQREIGIQGCTGEIGVASGGVFVPLALCCRPDEYAVAIDIFDQAALNWDPGGGSSSLAEFRRILAGMVGGEERVRYIQGDSFFLRSDVVRAVTDGTGFRLFSIDGAHSAHHTVGDLRLAGELVTRGGIVMLDDIQNWGWPGVITGFARYMLLGDHQRLVPFFLYGNKLLLTTPSHREFYLEKTVELATLYGMSLENDDYRISDFFGYRTMGW